MWRCHSPRALGSAKPNSNRERTRTYGDIQPEFLEGRHVSPSTKHAAEPRRGVAPTTSQLHDVVEQLKEIRREHLQRKVLNEELFRSLSSDSSIDAGERQSARVAAAAAEEVCAQVDYAMSAIRAGEYGVCLDCHETIPLERLEAVPLTRRCVSCPPH